MPDNPQTLRGRSVMPSLTVNDLQQSERFFTALGFEIEDRWEDNGVLLGLMLKAGEARLGLSQDDGKKGTDRVKGVGVRLYIEADGDIDAVAARAKGRGRQPAARAARHRMGRARVRGHRSQRISDHDRVAGVLHLNHHLIRSKTPTGASDSNRPRPSS